MRGGRRTDLRRRRADVERRRVVVLAQRRRERVDGPVACAPRARSGVSREAAAARRPRARGGSVRMPLIEVEAERAAAAVSAAAVPAVVARRASGRLLLLLLRKHTTKGQPLRAYLLLTIILKGVSYQKFTKELAIQNINYITIKTKPTPLNTILWTANVETKNSFFIGNSSFFDQHAIHFSEYPKNHYLLGDIAKHQKTKRMIAISKGWYTINKKDNNLYFNDLRFGVLSMQPNATNFVFKYKIKIATDGTPFFLEEPKEKSDGKKLLLDLWVRIKGN